MPSTVAFTTLGCRLNQAESDAMGDELAARGIVAAAPHEAPDIVVVNTCTVTREATKASRMAIRRAVRAHPSAKIVVVGCYAVSDPEEIEAIDGVDVVLGNTDKERFAEALSGAPATASLLSVGFRRSSPSYETAPQRNAGGLGRTSEQNAGGLGRTPEQNAGGLGRTPDRKVRANLKVQTGCDEWCTFCIIPVTRGPLRSMDEDALVAEARARVAAGARELVLTGVHLGKYTYDTGGDERRLVGLLRRLLDVDGVWRIRLSSILSRHLTDELIAFIADEPRICRYLHVPLQSGDDGVLAAMHRPYLIDEYIERVEAAVRTIPGVALATDIIVGFPGETESAFVSTLSVVERLRFSKLHVFRYSARPDTPAAEMSGEVPPGVKKERSKRLIELGNDMRGRFLGAHVGRDLEVLVEDERLVDGASIASGQTSDYVRVWFEASGVLAEMAVVTGRHIRADGIRGELSRV